MRTPRVVVTGFSSFPGAHRNPTEALVHGLDPGRLSRRFGVELAAEVMPTEYDAVARRLTRLWTDFAPDAALHLGLHGRAATVRIETRASNHMSPVRPDAAGVRPQAPAIAGQGPAIRRTSLPVSRMAAAMDRRRIPVRLSSDAGGYLCNFAIYLSLGMASRGALAGFVHLPWPAEARVRGAPAGRPPWSVLEVAVEEAIRVAAIAARAAMREKV